MAEKPKFYVVWKGRRTGVFSSWEACAAQVQGYTGAQYKSFTSRLAADQALRGKYSAHVGKPVSSGDWLFAPNPPVAKSVVVDAACSGSPGRLEYRGVDLRTGKEIFRQGPYENGTNNVGEFLAIVHALMMLEQQGSTLPRAPSPVLKPGLPRWNRDYPAGTGTTTPRAGTGTTTPRAGTGTTTPVYSDSETAITWVKAKLCNTELAADKTNAPLFELINRAEDWLAEHKTANPVLKWDTKAWGEIPADFNRK
jgi:ribonuclease HI